MSQLLIKQYNPTRIAGTVVGDAAIKVDDFNEIKCPFCGRELQVSGMEMPTSDHLNTIVLHADSHVDGAGRRHTRYFGRSDREIESQIRMRCPRNCIRDMLVNIKNVVVGPYRHLTEYD